MPEREAGVRESGVSLKKSVRRLLERHPGVRMGADLEYEFVLVPS